MILNVNNIHKRFPNLNTIMTSICRYKYTLYYRWSGNPNFGEAATLKIVAYLQIARESRATATRRIVTPRPAITPAFRFKARC